MKKLLSFLFITLLLMTACAKASDGELKIEDLELGTGDAAADGDVLEVHYVGTLEDETKFDSSRDRDATFSFTLGAGEVIQGWDDGMKGMKVGGLRNLTIPSEMGYGDRSVGSIPADSTLIFEVELIGIQ
jgi:FKBP-type peptidyl-prolyl cis-trans isomerase